MCKVRLFPDVLNVRCVRDVTFFVLQFVSFLLNAVFQLIDWIRNTVRGTPGRIADMREVSWRVGEVGDSPKLLVEPATKKSGGRVCHAEGRQTEGGTRDRARTPYPQSMREAEQASRAHSPVNFRLPSFGFLKSMFDSWQSTVA